MKKRNLKLLTLKKDSVAKLSGVNGGQVAPSFDGYCPVGSQMLTCIPEDCEETLIQEICLGSFTCISVPNGTRCCPGS